MEVRFLGFTPIDLIGDKMGMLPIFAGIRYGIWYRWRWIRFHLIRALVFCSQSLLASFSVVAMMNRQEWHGLELVFEMDIR